jgi:hypothetical protein
MTEEIKTGEGARGANRAGAAPQLPLGGRLPQPGLAAIALYLLMLAGVIIVGVVSGRHYPPVYLLFSAVFMAACAGLLLMLRWAWALALSAVFLLAAYYAWIFIIQHQPAALIQGMLNLVFFFYLVRTEVRKKLR